MKYFTITGNTVVFSVSGERVHRGIIYYGNSNYVLSFYGIDLASYLSEKGVDLNALDWYDGHIDSDQITASSRKDLELYLDYIDQLLQDQDRKREQEKNLIKFPKRKNIVLNFNI